MNYNFWREILALKWTPWYRWHPELALRYLPVVEWIKKQSTINNQQSTISVLEVGSGGLGIAPYLKMPVTGVDVKFEPPIHPLLTPVTGRAEKLNFADSSFDFVISMDMLEHLPESNRQLSVSEMMRVAKIGVIIGVPCGEMAENQDEELRQEYIQKYGRDFIFFREQAEFGLPREADIISYIKAASEKLDKKVKIVIKGNENLGNREFLMKGWMSKNILVNILFRKILLLFISMIRMIEKPPYYRKIFFVKLRDTNLRIHTNDTNTHS